MIAYGGIFTWLGLRVRRALVWGLAYILLWEGFVASAGKSASRLAVRAYTRSVLAQATGVDLKLANVSAFFAVTVPIAHRRRVGVVHGAPPAPHRSRLIVVAAARSAAGRASKFGLAAVRTSRRTTTSLRRGAASERRLVVRAAGRRRRRRRPGGPRPAVRSSMRPARASTVGRTPPRYTDPMSRDVHDEVGLGRRSAGRWRRRGRPPARSPADVGPERVDQLQHEPVAR